jgi:hypothetical protein
MPGSGTGVPPPVLLLLVVLLNVPAPLAELIPGTPLID